jgi:hypothetical protein
MVAGSAGGIHSLNQVAPACADWRMSSRVRSGSCLRCGPPATTSNGPGLVRWASMKRRIAVTCCGVSGCSLSVALPGVSDLAIW